ncbi:MAG: hypothetical protein V2I46_13095 [Bacteroides sp.]|jgi:hypothetical protein|nr:hypothetical protein [Bacteroides sp.]
MPKKTLLWVFAFLLTLGAVYYTRLTGPTKPYRGSVVLNGETISYSLIRTYAKPENAPARILVPDDAVSGHYRYKRTPSHDEWTEAPLVREGDELIAYIPQQPSAGKVAYQVTLEKDGEQAVLSEEPIVIRFRNDVPAWTMIPHILFMFAAIFLSTRTGLSAIFNKKTYGLTLATLILLFAGGLIFGPIVQKYAFGAFWTGWPFGTDLTDNKTLVMFIFWLIAFWKVRKNPKHRTWVIIAAVVTLIAYMIPHSLLGSEIDYTQEGIQ